MTTSHTSQGPRFGPAEKAALARLHEQGLTSHRYDGPPAGHDVGMVCPCLLVRQVCPARRPWEQECVEGRRALAGRDHPDQWYRDASVVAVVHYPYGMEHDHLTESLAGATALGLQLDIDALWAIHAADQGTLAVVLSSSGLHDVLNDGPARRRQ